MATNFIVLKSNTRTTDVDFEYSQNFNEPLLKNSGNYSVAITRLKIPSHRIENFKMNSDQSDYFIRMRGTNLTTLAETNYTNNLPDSTDSLDASVYYGGVQYYSTEQVLDTMSRTMYKSYEDFTKSFGGTYTEEVDDLVQFDSDSGGNVSTHNENYTTTITGNIAHIEFEVEDFTVSTSAWDRATNPAHTKTGGNVRVLLTSPDGTTCELMKLCGSHIDQDKGSASTIIFTEGAYNTIDHHLDTNVSTKTTHKYVPMVESFLKFAGNATPNGSWNIQVDTDENVYGALKFKLRIYTTPNNYPTTAPTLSLDTNNKIMLSYEETMVRQNITICLSPKVASMCDFNPNTVYNSSHLDYEFEYPAYTFNATNTIIDFVQQNSSRHALSNISRILVNSTLPVFADFQASSTPSISADQVLTDFTINTEDLAMGVLLYSSDASIRPWRTYRLKTGNQSLHNITIWFEAEYDNGKKERVALAPGTQGLCRLSFF